MVIFQNNIKRLLRDKYTFLMMFVIPIIFISFILFSVGGSRPISVSVIDKDNTELTKLFLEDMSKNCKLVDIKENEIQKKLIRGRTDYVILIEKGFSEAIIKGEDVRLKTYNIKETNSSMAAQIYADSFINAIKNIGKASNGNEASFYEGMAHYKDSSLGVEYTSLGKSNSKRAYTVTGIGYLLMFMMYLAVNSTSLVLQDKQLKTYGRVLAAPVSTKMYTLQNFLSGYLIVAVQVTLILLIMRYVFKADFGPALLSIYAFILIFAITAIALSAMINSFSKDSRQANSMSSLLIVPMCMLGGAFWPRWLMPDLLRKISSFVPVSWALDALEKLIYGRPFSSVLLEVAIVMLFALVFFLISANKKRVKNA